jgi:hypothetical protein
MLSTILSVVAVAISLFSLGWQIARSKWERPVVVVGGLQMQIASGGKGGEPIKIDRVEYHVDVSNIGERPVTVTDAGWITSHGGPGTVGYTGLTDKVRATLPLRLEPHDSHTFILNGAAGHNAVDIPFVKVVQRPTWWEKRRGVLPSRTIVGTLGSDFAPWVPQLSAKVGKRSSRSPSRG